MSAVTGWTFIACPKGIAAECQTLRRVILPWRILPGSGKPSSASSRPAVRNGSPWAHLEAEGVAARQVPPAQVKAFAQSRSTHAKTDRIDAELIARFFALLPEGGRSLLE
ncbi:IS110 family transposase [Haematobacter genomosp. 1]|uniref:IS110 family transposase n=1 Tax=Haematobacter genomosp. 1 TaxID=366618 RepID=UPI0035948D29